MPPPVRRKLFVLVFVLGAVLALASVAYAGNGGFAPLTPHSPNAKRINDSYLWISIFTAAIFALVEGSLLWFVFKYRRRGRSRTIEGPQIHGATRLELIWTAIPVLILAAILIAWSARWRIPGVAGLGLIGWLALTGSLAIQENGHPGLASGPIDDVLSPDAGASEGLALGCDQRVDSGDMQYIELVFAYGCIGKDDLGSRHAGGPDQRPARRHVARPERKPDDGGGEGGRTIPPCELRPPRD